ncbi:MAG: penicillin-binding protein 2 [Oligoflexia bacterium]|nr:penicillin-binding protein 2 [Oligoflexia bacterium]
MFDHEGLIKLHRARANLMANIILMAFSIILARLWYLQVYKGKILYSHSLQNQLRQEKIEAPRGMFFDRNQKLIVNNAPRFDAVITPQYLRNKKLTISSLSKILNMPEDIIYKKMAKKSTLAKYKSIVIKKNITRQEVALIETQSDDLPGVSVETFISREYIDQEIGGHLLGYISEISQKQLPKYIKRDHLDYKLGDFIGQFGLEEQFDKVIRGKNGFEFVEVDAVGRKKSRTRTLEGIYKEVEDSPSIPGLNILLTIDRDLQLSAYNQLQGHEGAAIALDVNTGEVLAMVSMPAFDPSNFSKGLTNEFWSSLTKNPRNPLRDRNIQEHYPPGSTFKPIVALAGLEEGLIDEKSEAFCTGKFPMGSRVFHCWKEHGHGSVDLIRSIRESCDTFYYKLGKRIDIDIVAHYSKMLGLGQKTGIALPREVGGIIPSREWKRKRLGEDWMMGETLSCVIGGSYMMTTPIQLALAYSVIANGGKLYRPFVVKKIFSNSGKVYKTFNPELMAKQNLSEKSLSLVREGLRQVANVPSGTAYSGAHGRGINLAGKTGTAQVIGISADKLFEKMGCEKMDYDFRNHALFVGYAPADDPKIAIAAIVEHGCHGASLAVPVVEAIASTYMKKYYPNLHAKYLEEEKAKGILWKAPKPPLTLAEKEALKKKAPILKKSGQGTTSAITAADADDTEDVEEEPDNIQGSTNNEPSSHAAPGGQIQGINTEGGGD